MRNALVRFVRLLVGLFYRRVEVTGLEHVPREGPVLFIANHNNGLVDPMVVLHAIPRPVVFVAKSTLWKIPVLRWLLDLLGCVPVVRRGEEDQKISLKGEERNRDSFERLAAVLDEGSTTLVFPEGRSHSDPRLSELRTGAARILLLSKESPVVVPLGLWFTKKEEFRSEVLVRIGAPVPTPRDPTVEAWTEVMGKALEAVTLNADDWEDHEVAAAVDALYGERIREDFLEGGEGTAPLARTFSTLRVLLAARASLEKARPGEVSSLACRVRTFDTFLRNLSLSPSSLDDPPRVRTILRHTLSALARVLLGFPAAVVGVVAWWVPYRLCGFLAKRVPGAAKERDQIALYKLLAGLGLFPPFFIAEVAAIWRAEGPAWGAVAVVLLPFAGISSLLFYEYAAWRERQVRELLAFAFFPGGIARLRARRDALVAECDRLAEVFRTEADNRRT